MGDKRREGSRMMRKTSLVLLGAAAGAALTLVLSQPRVMFVGAAAKAAVSDTYRQLNLFGDVFERVRSDYVEKPDDGKLIEFGHQRHADRARSAFELHGSEELQGHADPDAGRVRRPRHRGHHGGRPGEGRRADRRDAGRQGRRHGERHHHPSRRRAGPGSHPQPGGREDARAGQHQDPAEDHAQGRRTSRSR